MRFLVVKFIWLKLDGGLLLLELLGAISPMPILQWAIWQ
jgi:hypothetical protein